MSAIYQPFISAQDSHGHSLATLNMFYEFDDFMSSVGTLVDMGCGEGLDLEWWATRTTRDSAARPLNIQCVGMDIRDRLNLAKRYNNLRYQKQDFEQEILMGKRKYDVIWCHDSFQYVIDPLATLRLWRGIIASDGVMILILPQFTTVQFNKLAFDQPDGCYWNWTMVSLIHALAVTGWDCRAGYFRKDPDDCWLYAAVYPSKHTDLDPKATRWLDLAEKNLLFDSAVTSIQKHGYLRQRDLLLTWVDKSKRTMFNH